jgi:hypothetical protein
MDATFKPIPKYNGLYLVNEHGVVYSTGRFIIRSDGRKRTCKPRILSQRVTSRGYLMSTLTDINGTAKATMVHRLVASAFLGDKENMLVDHIDGNKKNNHVSNLRYCHGYENLTFRNTEKKYKNDTPNIYFDASRNQYYVTFQRNKVKITLGRFKTKEDAVNALNSAKCLYEQQQLTSY